MMKSFKFKHEDAFAAARRASKRRRNSWRNFLGAAIHAALEVARNLGKGKKVLAIIPDNGERYLSTALYQYED